MSEAQSPPDTTRQTRSERYEELIDNLDPQLKGKADYGASAARKAMLSRIPVPNHVLDSIGVEVPHRTYLDDADNRVTRKTTVDLPNSDGSDGTVSNGDSAERVTEGQKVHLHQDVREADDGGDAFGSFGAAEEDTDDVVWTVVNLDDGTVTLKVVGEWGKSRDPTYEEFADEYEPVYCTTDDGEKVVRFGY